MLEARVFCSTRKGPHLLMIGGVHGDEPCGTVALNRLAQEISSGKLLLECGRLTLVPMANPKAQGAGTRLVDVNLNRVLRKHENPHHYEHYLANSICDHVEQVDAVIDLHAVTAKSPPFTFLDWDTPATRAWINALGVPFALTGWDDLYPPEGENSSSTSSYAFSKGKTAVAVECGQKTDPASAEVAYTMARVSLAHFGLTPAYAYTPQASTVLRMKKVVWKEKEGKLTAPFENFSPVRAGQVLAVCEDGEKLTAANDGYIIMPKDTAVIGEEWYYLAEKA